MISGILPVVAKKFNLLKYTTAAAVIAVITLPLWLLRDFLSAANVALAYVLATLVIAIWLGTGPSLLAVAASFLAFNFFLIRPFYTLVVEDPRELIDLFIYLLVAVIVGQLAAYARQQAQQAQRSHTLEEADKLKTALLHAVSHDLRTPLTIIKTSASSLRAHYQRLTVEEQLEMVETIESEADRLNQLVGNLLDMSRLKAGAMILNKEWNSLAEIAGDVAARAWQRHQTEQVRLCFSDDLPLVLCDYGLVLQALANVVDNVLRYEAADSQVEIRGVSHKGEVRLAIINHGPDIPDGEKEQIMEPFYHGPDGHIGLGLAISQGIIELHGGRLWVEDTPGGGATFVLALPLAITHPTLRSLPTTSETLC
jgi:two-component system, OmpR family, sensor histidine kinase KdpD